MSRKIKYRVWDEEKKKYCTEYNAMTLKHDGEFCIERGWCTISGGFVVEQYTGLKDKNGKEIYEGDILWWEHFHGMTGENIETTAEVYWEEKDASFVVGDWFEPLGHLIDEDEVEVIGNIHENPELLGDEE